MTKLELAQKKGVDIIHVYSSLKGCIWCADITGTNQELIRKDKIFDLIKFLADNKIKINK